MQGHVGVTQVAFGGRSADLIGQCGECRPLRSKSALKGLGVQLELFGDQLESDGARGQQMTHDRAHRFGDGRVVQGECVEILHDGLVCQRILLEWTLKVGGADGQAADGLIEKCSAAEELVVCLAGGQRFVGQVNRQR